MNDDVRRRRGISCVAATALALVGLCACGDDGTTSPDSVDSSAPLDAQAQDGGNAELDAMLDSSSDAHVPEAGDADANVTVDAGVEGPLGPISTALLDDVWLKQAPTPCGGDDECDEPASCNKPSPSSAGICAPACVNDDDCSPTELCFEGYDGGDRSCFAVVGGQEACGIPFVQLCDTGLTCFPLSAQGRAGACFAVCAPDLARSGCPLGTSCLGGWIDGDGNPLGICADSIGLGQRCDEPFGAQLRCAVGTVCAPDDDPAVVIDTQWRCRVSCADARLCSGGQCRVFGRVDGNEARACY